MKAVTAAINRIVDFSIIAESDPVGSFPLYCFIE